MIKVVITLLPNNQTGDKMLQWLKCSAVSVCLHASDSELCLQALFKCHTHTHTNSDITGFKTLSSFVQILEVIFVYPLKKLGNQLICKYLKVQL